MPCFHPIQAWKGGKTASGKRKLVFSPNGAVGLPLAIPCGQCIGCRLERARQWSMRLSHEAQFHEASSFLTLTYSPEHLPPSGSLSVDDLQRFQKRLRERLRAAAIAAGTPPPRLRFFSVGEYGDQLSRPHYHCILFGWDFRDTRKRWTLSRENQVYVSEFLQDVWGLGHCYIGSVTPQSCGYVARYAMKKVNGDRKEAHYGDKKPEFMICSKGIGRAWFEKYRSDFDDDKIVFNGKKCGLPKYYDRLIAQESESELEGRKGARKAQAVKHWRNRTPARLAVREEVTQARIKNLKREL